MKKQINTINAPQPIGPYSQAIVAGDWIFTAGQIPLNSNGEMVKGPIKKRMHQVMQNLGAILASAGATFADVVNTTAYVTDPQILPQINSVYMQYMSEPYPARTTVTVKALPMNAKIEMSMIAFKKRKLEKQKNMKTYKDINAQAYNLVAANYKAEHSETLEWEAQLQQFITLLNNDKATVVDLGSGPGTESIWLANQLPNGKVYAVDIAEHMFKTFESKPVNLQTVAADMVSFSPGVKVDGIWARASIHHLSKQEVDALFANIKHYLKSAGTLMMINKYGNNEEIETKQKYGQELKRYFQYLDEGAVIELAAKHGFAITKQEIIENDHKWLVSVLINS